MQATTSQSWVPSPSWARQVCNRIRLIDHGSRSVAPTRLTPVIHSDDTTFAVVEEIAAILVCVAQGVVEDPQQALATLDEDSLAILCLLEELRDAVRDDRLDVALAHSYALIRLTLEPSRCSMWMRAMSERIQLLVTQFAFPCAVEAIAELRQRVPS